LQHHCCSPSATWEVAGIKGKELIVNIGTTGTAIGSGTGKAETPTINAVSMQLIATLQQIVLTSSFIHPVFEHIINILIYASCV